MPGAIRLSYVYDEDNKKEWVKEPLKRNMVVLISGTNFDDLQAADDLVTIIQYNEPAARRLPPYLTFT